jgi:hypothetical protein
VAGGLATHDRVSVGDGLELAKQVIGPRRVALFKGKRPGNHIANSGRHAAALDLPGLDKHGIHRHAREVCRGPLLVPRPAVSEKSAVAWEACGMFPIAMPRASPNVIAYRAKGSAVSGKTGSDR